MKDSVKENTISIIVPVYKVPEQYLKKCIESLIVQTEKNIEIILIDDESPDNCGIICDEYARKDNRIKVIHQKNKGLSGARNSGVSNCTGNWIMFVDGDDYLENNTCEVLKKNIREDLDVICFGAIRETHNKSKKMTYNYLKDGHIYETKEELRYMQKLILNFNANIATAWAKLINKNFLTQNNIFHNEKLKQGAEGIEFNTRLFNKAKKIKFINEHLYHYIYNEKSISAMPTEENNIMILNCFKQIKENIDYNDPEMIDIYYNRIIYVIVTTAISGYFNPKIQEKYKNRVKKFENFLKNDIITETLNKFKENEIDIQRRIIIYVIKKRHFKLLNIIAKLKNILK